MCKLESTEPKALTPVDLRRFFSLCGNQYLFGNCGAFSYVIAETARKPLLSESEFAHCLGTGLRRYPLFNRLIEYEIDLGAMQASGGPWASLHQASQLYEPALNDRYACDFAHLPRHFHKFIASNASNAFLQGSQDGFNIQLPLTHVPLDEYQDTNPIQESVYLRLCDTAPHNLTVVGDNAQAL